MDSSTTDRTQPAAPTTGATSTEAGASGAMAGQVAVITGGGRGVGLGIARRFLAEGAKVVITDLDDDLVQAVEAELGNNGIALRADVTEAEQMRAACQTAVDRFGSLDTVVANAGVGASARLGAITSEQFHHIFDVNVKGVLFTVQSAMPHLSSGGTVVIIGSTASIQAVEAMSLYGGSKAALRGMVRAWIKDVDGSGIRINLLTLGAVDTPSLRTALADASGDEAVDGLVARMGAGNPLGRLAQPDEIGRAAVFLSTDASSFMTGSEVFADGGMAQTG